MVKETFDASCVNCKFWKEMGKSNPTNPPHAREGTCLDKYKGDYVSGDQYCLGFQKKKK